MMVCVDANQSRITRMQNMLRHTPARDRRYYRQFDIACVCVCVRRDIIYAAVCTFPITTDGIDGAKPRECVCVSVGWLVGWLGNSASDVHELALLLLLLA